MTILFLDQSGELGGAELCLLDILSYGDRRQTNSVLSKACVALFAEGPFQRRLHREKIEHHLVGDLLPLRQERFTARRRGREILSLWQPIKEVLRLAQDCELLYANTPKAMIVGAIVHQLTGLPLVYHLHDILSAQHFGQWECRLLVRLASRCAIQVIANSQTTSEAFVAAGGNKEKVTVIYNGFLPEQFAIDEKSTQALEEELGLIVKCGERGMACERKRFTIGSFSRLAPWKGQSLLLEAIAALADPSIQLLLVGEALFGESKYSQQLRRQTETLGLQSQVQFLSFRDDVPQLLSVCDLVVHSPKAPEPFGRVMVEGMLAGRAVIAPLEGSAPELLRHNDTGWLIPPRDSDALTQAIRHLKANPNLRQRLGRAAAIDASQRFHLEQTNHQIYNLCHRLLQSAEISQTRPPDPGLP